MADRAGRSTTARTTKLNRASVSTSVIRSKRA
jgi:Natural resistance-associated macrophage protein